MQVQESATVDQAAGQARVEVRRTWVRWGAVLLAVAAVGQLVASLTDDKQSVRDSWWSDTLFVLIASTLFGGVALALALRGASGSRSRASRTVVGLTAFALVLSVVAWFTAAPSLTALAALALGRATGVSDRTTGTGAARAAGVISVVVIVGMLVFTNSILLVENVF